MTEGNFDKPLKYTKLLLNFFLFFCIVTGRPEERTLLNFAGNLLRDVLKITTNTVLKVSEKCSNPTIDNIKIYLYTRNASENPIVVNFIEPSKVNTEKKIIILIHGYISKAQNHELLDIKNAYLEKYDCNVIMVDWSQYAWTSYPSVVCILPKVANLLGNFLCTLSKQKQYKLKNIHLVGHSLGAQMSGLIGQAVKAECQQVIGRITGLDPAGPLYLDAHIDERLDATDAEFVDIIHTNGGIFGYLTNTGHADFYPNCGTIQFCKVFPIALEEILKLPVSLVSCHHGLSLTYMSESIRTNKYTGIPCDYCYVPLACPPIPNIFSRNKPAMGENCPLTTRGNYYVFTLL